MSFGFALVFLGIGWWLVSNGLEDLFGHGAVTVWSGVFVLALSFLWRDKP